MLADMQVRAHVERVVRGQLLGVGQVGVAVADVQVGREQLEIADRQGPEVARSDAELGLGLAHHLVVGELPAGLVLGVQPDPGRAQLETAEGTDRAFELDAVGARIASVVKLVPSSRKAWNGELVKLL